MNLLWFLLIGLAAGWIAGQVMKAAHPSLVGDLVVGVVGAILGGFLFGLLGFRATNLIGQLVSATVGAILLIAGLRAWGRTR